MPRNLLLALACTLAVAAAAQPTWRFHLAFEDGTGAKDTLWFIYDTTATLPVNPWPGPNVDYDLGEGPTDMNDGLFHVFTRNANWDSTNTVAAPYTFYPMFETGNTIDAINWTPPMTITWDTSLFHAPYLPYEQGSLGLALMDGGAFSAYSNYPSFGTYDMLISDSLTVAVLTDYLFPFSVYFGPDDHVGISAVQRDASPLHIAPNPARKTIHIGVDRTISNVQVMDLSGRTVLSYSETPIPLVIDISRLAPGTYTVITRSSQNQLYHGKFQKVD